MNSDSVWQIVRYVLIFAGGLAVSRGWLTNEQLVQIVGALGTIFVALWGLYVKWNTSPVLDKTITQKEIPVVNGLTGAVERKKP